MPCNTCNFCNQNPCRCGNRYGGNYGGCGNNYGGCNGSYGGGYGGGYGGWGRPRLSSFSFRKLSVLNGIPLANAVFQLSINGVVYATAVSDQRGVVRFNCLPAGTYTMTEVVSPQGFATSAATYTVVVAPNGFVTIDGQPTYNFIITNAPLPTPEFSVLKVDATTLAPLGGATFTLSQNNQVIRTVQTDAAGTAYFGTLTVGTYTLTELYPPTGYTANPTIYALVVNADGTITYNGETITSLTIPNTPTVTGSVAFTKVDSVTGVGLAGAEFYLYSGPRLAARATSGADGATAFNLVPIGIYTMVETTPPPGYPQDSTIHNVTVNEDGSVIIDGTPTTEGVTIPNTAAV